MLLQESLNTLWPSLLKKVVETKKFTAIHKTGTAIHE